MLTPEAGGGSEGRDVRINRTRGGREDDAIGFKWNPLLGTRDKPGKILVPWKAEPPPF